MRVVQIEIKEFRPIPFHDRACGEQGVAQSRSRLFVSSFVSCLWEASVPLCYRRCPWDDEGLPGTLLQTVEPECLQQIVQHCLAQVVEIIC